jgi:omega-hydroxy-beta-dihydromenaquinone-9 sulfotransferase
MKNYGGSPIFVIGTGRSGSTLFFDMLAGHPEVAWPSDLLRRYPAKPWLHHMVMRARSLGLLDAMLGSHYGPSEAYPFWEAHCPGFSNPCRDLVAEDVTVTSESRMRTAIAAMTTRKRHQFVAKITGWPRVRFLDRIFPHALFIEVSRDPRATACSLLEVDFWDGWRGPPNWRRGALPQDLQELWLQEKRSFVALAAIEYVIFQRAIAECVAVISPDRYMKVNYTDLCADPIAIFTDVIKFARLRWVTNFERKLRVKRLNNRDDQWKSTLTGAQQNILERTLERAQGMSTSDRPSA